MPEPQEYQSQKRGAEGPEGPPRVWRALLSCLPGMGAFAIHIAYQWTDSLPQYLGYAFFPLLLAGVIIAAWFAWTYRRRRPRTQLTLTRVTLAAHILVLIFGVPVVLLTGGAFLVERFKL